MAGSLARSGVIILVVLLMRVPAAGQLGALRTVVSAGQAAPGGGIFEHFSVESQPVVAPPNARGDVAFFASLLRGAGSEGLFLATPRGIVKVAVEGDRAPGGGSLSGLGRHPIPSVNAAGSVAFAAAVSKGRAVEGIFVSSRGTLRAVAVAGEPAPGIPSGTFATLDFPALNERGDVAFLATVRRGRETVEAIYVRAGGRVRKVVGQEDAAPAGGTFAAFGAPALNDAGVVAFAAVVEGRGVPGGVFTAAGDGVRMLAGAGADTPLGGIFAKFSERVTIDNAGAVAFTAFLRGARVRSAIFVAQGDRLKEIVALGDPAPAGGAFSSFGFWPALGSSGVVAFTASVDPGPPPIAVYVSGPSGVKKVAGIGDPLPGGAKLESFGLYPTVTIGPGGHVTFTTAPTATGEGGEGIYIADGARLP
jgi:hypothetical protein